jgi:chlorite dismutase
MERLAKPRLFPEVPARRYVSFYPMSKRRGEHVNWFDLAPRSAGHSCAATA